MIGNPRLTLKDQDFKVLENHAFAIKVGSIMNVDKKTLAKVDKRSLLIMSLTSDADFLCNFGVMDYSLMLIKVNMNLLTKKEIKMLLSMGNFLKKNKMEGYLIGIIDIFQTWTWEKQLERLGKVLRNGCRFDLDISA